MKRIPMVALSLLAAVAALHAAVTPVSRFQGFNDEPSLARTGEGKLFVSWLSFRDGFDTLQVAHYERDGETFRPLGTWQAAGGKDSYLHGSRLVAAGDQVYLVYAAEQAGNWDIFAVRCTAKGPGRAIRITSDPAVEIKPAAAWHDGTLWVVWESNRGSARHIWSASVPDGRAVSQPQQVSVEGKSNYGPSVVVAAGGHVTVAWHSFRSHNYDIYLRQRSARGGWQTERRITTAPSIDRHARLSLSGQDVWLLYENSVTANYRIGTTNQRRTVAVKLAPSGLTMPAGYDKSPLFAERTESAAAAFDGTGRMWVAHLRPRLPRGGWEVFLTGFNGSQWQPAARVSTRKGMDREPGLVIDGKQAVVAFQADEFPETWLHADPALTDNARSEIFLATTDLTNARAATAYQMAPFSEPGDDFEAARLHAAYGEDNATPEIEYKGEKLKLYYGDLHSHSDVSVCNRCGDQSIDEDFQHHRDLTNLDFAAVTDHGYNIVPYLWNYSAKLARMNSDPGRLLGLLGQEWTSSFERYPEGKPYGYYGHRNLIYSDSYFPKWWNANNGQTPTGLWAELRKMKANFIQIPHQLADTGNVPTDWNYTDETAQPVAEIFQVRGSYEYMGAPRQAGRATPEKGYFLQDAWEKGVVIGVIASPDHGGGLGKACVWARDFSREAILEGIRKRRTFGSTAARTVLDVRVNGHLMGEKSPQPPGGKPVTIKVTVHSPGEIARLEICRNSRFIYSTEPGGRSAVISYRDEAPLEGRSYYYVRVQQKDGEIAWSSPVWLSAP